ncbi:endonuclease [Legionella spiritensis]|uniref:Putative endonuclease-1 n=1 Tax=Legionella spiritensis TaxID=452 RepID=A0A0W0YXH2_LEGSP|nr:endonuclease [Legionella spiritensis]KTD61577.1 putative endonuclease-1 [Legionella spiritensis]SNV32372.1 putative endonuclease-1 [Legionella spiritensis]
MKKNFDIIVLFALLAISCSLYTSEPKSFSKSKKIAGALFINHRFTLYCQCRYDKNNKIDLSSCGMQSASNKKRAHRIEWEHMMPAENFGRQYRCWRESLCKDSKGRAYKGRKCCSKIDKAFRKAEAELYNLWPASGLINQIRSNYRYSSIPEKRQTYGCNFYADKVLRKAEPPDSAKGIVARANLFMADKYGIRLSRQQKQLFNAWNRDFPVTEFERTWSLRVARVEGYENPYIR